MALRRAVDQRAAGVVVGDIDRGELRLAARVLDLLHRRRALLGIAPGEHHGRARRARSPRPCRARCRHCRRSRSRRGRKDRTGSCALPTVKGRHGRPGSQCYRLRHDGVCAAIAKNRPTRPGMPACRSMRNWRQFRAASERGAAMLGERAIYDRTSSGASSTPSRREASSIDDRSGIAKPVKQSPTRNVPRRCIAVATANQRPANRSRHHLRASPRQVAADLGAADCRAHRHALRAYLFRVGRRTQYWIIYTVEEDSRTVDDPAFLECRRDPESFEYRTDRSYSSPGSSASSSVRQPGRGALTSTAMLPGGCWFFHII